VVGATVAVDQLVADEFDRVGIVINGEDDGQAIGSSLV
jgi:hypothetical protein